MAIVGDLPNPKRATHKVTSHLFKHGYLVIPVNPHGQEILDKTSYSDLNSISEPVEVVDIFRSSERIMPIVDEVIKIGIKAV